MCDAGRQVRVGFILDLAARVERLEERLVGLKAQARQDSRMSWILRPDDAVTRDHQIPRTRRTIPS